MTKKASSTSEPTVVNPLPLDPASGDFAANIPTLPPDQVAPRGTTPPAPPEAQVRKKTNFDKVLEKIEEIEVMASHGRPELRDTIRARCAEIRDILS